VLCQVPRLEAIGSFVVVIRVHIFLLGDPLLLSLYRFFGSEPVAGSNDCALSIVSKVDFNFLGVAIELSLLRR